MKTIYYIMMWLLTLTTGCRERKVTPAQVQPVSAWSDDSLVMAYQFQTWVQKFPSMDGQLGLRVAGKLITDESGHPERQRRLFALAEQYFHDPNSPYRNEDLYIPILEAFIAEPLLKEGEKERPRYQLERAMMNRPGSLATDFSFLTVLGKRMRLYEMESEYTLLYFFNPDCHDCGRVTHYLLSSPVFSDLQNRGLLKVLAVYPDEDLGAWETHKQELPPTWVTGRYATEEDRQTFDLPAIPTLYLLDKDKRVILKDAPVEYVEHGFMKEQ